MEIPVKLSDERLLDYSFKLSNLYKENQEKSVRKNKGQFFTAPNIANFMAGLAKLDKHEIRILDPGAGTGILTAAIFDRIIGNNKEPVKIILDAYETDKSIISILSAFLEESKKELSKHGHSLNFNVLEKDFVLTNTHYIEATLVTTLNNIKNLYDIIISNPPYFKLSKESPEAIALKSLVIGQPNIYSFFMALSASMLNENGQMIFITPRSFCSGYYYSKFRRWLLNRVIFSDIHLFSSRKDVFSNEDVLQENVIINAVKKKEEADINKKVKITTGEDDNLIGMNSIEIPNSKIIYKRNGDLYILIPSSELDLEIIDTISKFPYLLKTFDFRVSTGPVVPFRTKENLVHFIKENESGVVPLLWMHNFNDLKIIWPVFKNGNAVAIKKNKNTENILTAKGNYIIMKRFSSKEQKRRLEAAVLLEQDFKEYSHVGLENRLNYIYRKGVPLTPNEAYGLAAIFNLHILDLFFRILNGHTQVNANELNALPIPSLEDINKVGELSTRENKKGYELELEIAKVLKIPKSSIDKGYVLVKQMDKTKEALDILRQLQVPRLQQNERSALCLLAMLSIKQDGNWSEAKRILIRIHDIMQFINHNYNKSYAENSRETFRRQTLHQFEQDGLVERNPDEPRPTNSPNTTWAVHNDALEVIKSYGTEGWSKKLVEYLNKKGKNVEAYNADKKRHTYSIQINGKSITLSHGKHNKLQLDIVNEFRAKFCNNAKILYLGDTANKMLYLNEEYLKKLNVNITKHDKLPDVVLYDEKRDYVFLIEAVTSHGPVSRKRQVELEDFFKDNKSKKVFVSAFPNFGEFKRHISEIAWETEVWLSEIPEHMIHFNGDKFLKVE